MKKTVIICCKMLKDELLKAYNDCNCNHQIIWVEPELHVSALRLRSELKKQLLGLPDDIERVLMGFACCGNSLIGLEARNFEIVVPKVDDCISIIIGSDYERRKSNDVYYICSGTFKNEYNLCKEYAYTVEKYGDARANRIFDIMFKSYKTLGILDTGCYNINEVMTPANKIAKHLGLNVNIISASNTYLKKLICGEWNSSDFIRVVPHGKIKESDFGLLAQK